MIREINTIYKKRKRTQERARQEHKINTPFETAVQSYFFCITTHQIGRFSLPPAPSPRPWFSALEKWWEASEINIFLWKGRGRKWRKETKKRRCVRKNSVYQVNSFVQKKEREKGAEEDGKTRKLELKNAQEGIQKAFFVRGKERREIMSKSCYLSLEGKGKEKKRQAWSCDSNSLLCLVYLLIRCSVSLAASSALPPYSHHVIQELVTLGSPKPKEGRGERLCSHVPPLIWTNLPAPLSLTCQCPHSRQPIKDGRQAVVLNQIHRQTSGRHRERETEADGALATRIFGSRDVSVDEGSLQGTARPNQCGNQES